MQQTQPGSHGGRELELILRGIKPMAMFIAGHDALEIHAAAVSEKVLRISVLGD